MAYINKDTAKKIRVALKAAFPECKFSVRLDGAIALHVTVVKSPYFEDEENFEVNNYYIDDTFADNIPARDFLNKVDDIIKTEGEWWNKTNSQIDYFHIAFYYSIHVGTYDKPHVKVK